MSGGEGAGHEIDEVLTREALHDLTMAYVRGVDRGDLDLLLSIWHPDSTAQMGVFNGSGPEFSRFIVGFAAELKVSFHSVSNQWFEIRGDRAVGEGYVYALASGAADARGPLGLIG